MDFFKNLFGNKEKDKRIEKSTVGLGGGLIGAEQAKLDALASDEMRTGMANFLDMAQRVRNKGPSFRAGHQFETIVAAKENVAKALGGEESRNFVTHLEKKNTIAADLEERIGDQILREGQAKFSVQNPDKIAEMITDPKYTGMKRYVPANKIDGVRISLQEKYQQYLHTDPQRAANYLDASNNLQVHNTTTREVIIADRNPQLYAAIQEGKYVVREMAVTGGQAAAAGFIISGGISLIKNSIAVSQGSITGKEAIKKTLKDGGKGALRSGGVGVTGTAIRNACQKMGVGIKSSGAMALANSLIDLGGTIIEFSQGKITTEETIGRIGQNGVSTVSSLYAGAAAGMVFGPAGAIVGSIAGYLIASNVYQSGITILRSGRLAEEEARRVIALCEAASAEMRKEREAFERAAYHQIEVRRIQLDNIFDQINKGLDANDLDLTINGLSNFAELMGKELKLKNFQDFDNHMKNNDTLVL